MKKVKKYMVKIIIFSIAICAIVILIVVCKGKKVYYAEDFGIKTLISNTDYDNDGIDDYTDILEGAKKEAKNKPTYKSAYYSGGYPPENEGVCTDVIWRALKNAGYLLKDMVDEDIKNNIDCYPKLKGKIDPNIDFRRVISDKRNKKGIPYLIHNSGQPSREEDVLEKYDATIKITGHYRMK